MVKRTDTDIYACAKCREEWTGDTLRLYPWCEKDENPCYPAGVPPANMVQAFICPACKSVLKAKPKKETPPQVENG